MDRCTQRGFTLIELMVVTLVLAILIAATLPQFLGAKTRAQDGAARSNLRGVLEIAGTYAAANSGAYPDGATLTSEDGALGYVAGDAPSSGPRVISVSAGTGFSAAARSESGTCLSVTVPAGGGIPVWATPVGVCAAVPAPAGTVSTLASWGTGAVVSGSPFGLAIDSAGTLYAADYLNKVVRTVSGSGTVATLAGSGSAGSADGTGTAASFTSPWGIAVDSAGNAYVSDQYKVRKIAPGGVVTTFAGSGTSGYADGTGTGASFAAVYGVAVDGSDNVYVADGGNNRIRKITPAGVVTTLAGSGSAAFADGTGSAASFSTPLGVGTDAAGNVFVADGGNHRIRKITPAGVVTTVAGSGSSGFADGTGAAASFATPHSVIVDAAGTMYVGDRSNQRIRRISATGDVTTLAGTGTYGYNNGSGGRGDLQNPSGLALGASGALYVADSAGKRIRMIV